MSRVVLELAPVVVSCRCRWFPPFGLHQTNTDPSLAASSPQALSPSPSPQVAVCLSSAAFDANAELRPLPGASTPLGNP